MTFPTPAPRHQTSRGATLIEVLVVIVVLSIVAAILLPALQSARETSRKTHCLNNLRQIGLAIVNYHETMSALPLGRFKMYDPRYAGSHWPCSSTSVDKSLLVQVLPFIEQSTLYSSINQSTAMLGPENTTTWSHSVASYSCPSDFDAGRKHPLDPDRLTTYSIPGLGPGAYVMVFTSYSGCFGSLTTNAMPQAAFHCIVSPRMIAQNNGCFNDLQRLNLASVTDGLSNTMLISEKVNLLGGFDRTGWWVSGNLGDTLFSALYPPNVKSPSADTLPPVRAASSRHADGVNAMMADGSARFIKDSIDSWPFDTPRGRPVGSGSTSDGCWDALPRPGVWQALATRSDGEIIGTQGF